MIEIKLGLLIELLEASKSSYPNEFFAYLGASGGVTDKYYIIPYHYTSRDSVSVRADLLPLGFKVAGTFHSHPTGPAMPSDQDVETFSKTGHINIISSYPYTLDTTKFYDGKGMLIKNIDII